MVVVIYLQFLQEKHGFVTFGDVSENAGVIICFRSGIATDAHTAVSFLVILIEFVFCQWRRETLYEGTFYLKFILCK
jgi:hypothetical protein